MEQSKNRKTMSIIIGIAILVIGLIGVSYSFFNYTRTGTRNIIKTGRIYFNSEQDTAINLTNMFPIDVTNGIPNDNTKVGTVTINVIGDTTYDEGIEYLVSAVNVQNSVNNKTLPISIDIGVSNNTTNDPATTLGTSDNDYYTNRGGNTSIYKILANDTISNNDRLLVGYITKGATGIDGNIVIKAYLDKAKIAIVDTYDGNETDNMGTTTDWVDERVTFTTSEWNSLQQDGVSFQIKVEANEGIWVENIRTLYGIMQDSAVMDNIASTYVTSSSGINFGEISSDTNGKGVYTRAGTENDAYPIMYYRGDVNDNNVKFANKCWKAVRTTDTGGVKLIYNGLPSEMYERTTLAETSYTKNPTNTDSRWIFDSTDNTWNIEITDNSHPAIEFTVPTGNDYSLVMTGTSGSSCGGSFLFYKNGTSVTSRNNGGGGAMDLTYEFSTLTSTDVIKMAYTGNSSSTCAITFKLKMIGQGELITSSGCNNTKKDAFISLSGINTFVFNSNYNSPASLGYMYGDVYTINTDSTTNGAYYGTSFEYGDFDNDGTTEYRLISETFNTVRDGTHHYTCNLTNVDGTCTTLRYYFYQNYYVNLTDGDGIEEALTRMQTNTNNSIAKEKIDTWYNGNMNLFTNKLEDTVWCNDRGFGNENNNGWIANGGSLTIPLYFGTMQRSNKASNTSTVKNQPSLVCANINDSFTVGNTNGNGALDYPVALLTGDEIVLAGGVAGTDNPTFYLNNGDYFWSLSPSYFDNNPHEFYVNSNGGIDDIYSLLDPFGLRPSVSLKSGTPVVSGTGTVADPYVIE